MNLEEKIISKINEIDTVICNDNCSYLFDTINVDNILCKSNRIFNKITKCLNRHKINCLKSSACTNMMKRLLEKHNLKIEEPIKNGNVILLYIYAHIAIKKKIDSNLFVEFVGSFFRDCFSSITLQLGNINPYEIPHTDSDRGPIIKKIITLDLLTYSEQYVTEYHMLELMLSDKNEKSEYMYNFFKKMFDEYFSNKDHQNNITPMTIFNRMINLSSTCTRNTETIMFHMLKYIIQSNYIVPTNECMDIVMENNYFNISFIEFLMDNKVILTKKHLHKLFHVNGPDIWYSSQKTNNDSEVVNVPKTILDMIEKNDISIDYDDVLYCCERYMRFPDEYVSNMTFDERYFNICKRKRATFYNTKITGTIPYCIENLEQTCLEGIRLNDIKKIIKATNIVPSQKCLENSCCVKGNMKVIEYLLTFGLTINDICMANMLINMKDCDEKTILMKHYEDIVNKAKNNVTRKIIKVDKVLNKNDKHKNDKLKKSGTFNPICRNAEYSKYITLSEFKNFMKKYIVNLSLQKGEYIIINHNISCLSSLEDGCYIHESDLSNLSALIFTNN